MSWQGLVGGAADYGIGKASSKLQWDRTKRMMQKRHQWEVSDLRKAGLNPILSAGGAPSMGSPQQQGGTDLQEVGEQYIKARQNRATRNKMKAEREVLASQLSINAAHTNKLKAETRHSEQLGTIAMMGIPRAALEASIAGSASGQMAAKSGVWMEHVKAGAQVAGALALWMRRLGIAMPVAGMPGAPMGGGAKAYPIPPRPITGAAGEILRKK